MKKELFILLILLVTNNVYSQNDIGSRFESLQLNSSPAYVILGVDPENIQRPNSPSDFIANVQSAVVNERLQPNFALETSPYYWKSKKFDPNKFNVLEYVSNRNYWENLNRSIAFSFATSPTDSFTFGKIPIGTGLGIGMHFQLTQGRLSKNVSENLLSWFYTSRTQSILSSIVAKLEAPAPNNSIEDLNDWLDEEIFTIGNFKSIPEYQKEALKELLLRKVGKISLKSTDLVYVKRIRSQIEKKSKKAIGNVNAYQFPLTREGFILEFSIANARVAENSRWEDLKNAKTAIWLTPSFRFNVNKDPTIIDIIDVMAVARITFNNKMVDTSDYFDGGLKLQWIHNRINLSAEGIIRYLTNKPEKQKKGYTWRSDVSFSYKVNDFITFKTTFGSNFDGNSLYYSEPKKMFVVGGFNFGFSNYFKQMNKSQ